jgi:hypothetical protein
MQIIKEISRDTTNAARAFGQTSNKEVSTAAASSATTAALAAPGPTNV